MLLRLKIKSLNRKVRIKMNIKKQLDPDDYSSRNGEKIKYIVIHDTGNFKDTDEANANYFCGGKRKSSAHYFVDEDSITQLVEDYNSAWHCGDGHGRYGITNSNSLGIEMCNSGGFISEKTIKNTIELVIDLMKEHNVQVDNIKRHYDASRKICPQNMSEDNWKLWYQFIERIKEMINAENKPKKYNINFCLAFQKWYNQFTKAKLVEDGIYGPNTEKALEKISSIIRDFK